MSITSNRASDSYTKLEEKIHSETKKDSYSRRSFCRRIGKKILRSIFISSLFVNSFTPSLSVNNVKLKKTIGISQTTIVSTKNNYYNKHKLNYPVFKLTDNLENKLKENKPKKLELVKVLVSLKSLGIKLNSINYHLNPLNLKLKDKDKDKDEDKNYENIPRIKEKFRYLEPIMSNNESTKNDFSNRSEIPVLMYHGIGNGKYCVKPEKLRSDLETLKEKGFYFVNLQEFIDEDYFKIPQGKKPVLLTFDDSLNSQLKGSVVKGKFVPDPNCSIGILEDFFKHNPGVGKGAVFFANSHPFGTKFRKKKLSYLVNSGYDLEYHTRFHVSLRKETPEYVSRDLKKFEEEIRVYLPDYHSRAVAFPYGADPKKAVANLIKKRFLAAFDAEYHQPIRNSLYDVPRIEMSNRKSEKNNLQTFVLKKASQYFKKPLMIVSKK